jgi:hypothetical protein
MKNNDAAVKRFISEEEMSGLCAEINISFCKGSSVVNEKEISRIEKKIKTVKKQKINCEGRPVIIKKIKLKKKVEVSNDVLQRSLQLKKKNNEINITAEV